MRKTIVVVVAVVIVAAVAGGIYLFLNNSGNSTSGGAPGNLPAVTGTGPAATPAGVASAAPATTTPPSDAPQGSTFSLQGASGTVAVKNFYMNGGGYIPAMDVVVVEENASYTIWYYRSTSHFDIWLPADAAPADEASATAALANDLGVGAKTLCNLSVGVAYAIDGGSTTETGPLAACSGGAF